MRCARAMLAALVLGFAAAAAAAAPGAPPVPDTPPPATTPVAASGAPAAAGVVPAEGDGLVNPGCPLPYVGDQLFDFIDGGAPQYMEYGFVEAVSAELKFHDRTYIYDVYRMADPLAAYGIWSVRRPPRCTPLGTLPLSCVTLPQAMLSHGPYYIEVAAYENVPETVSEMAELVRRGVARVEAASLADDFLRQPPFTALPAPDRIAGTERLARGPVSVRTGLGREASGPLGPVVEALSAAVGPAPTWVMAGYHAQTPGDPTSAATTVVVLVGGAKTDLLWGKARGALPAEAQVTLPDPRLWLATHAASGQCVFGARSGSDLVLGASRLPAEALETWILQPTLQRVQP